MRNTLIALLLFFGLFAGLMSCGEKAVPVSEETNAKPLNPNGDSELALLMRAMFDELHQAKKQLAAGETISLHLPHEEILTAHATEPEKAASDDYKAFAAAYLQSVEALRQAAPARQQALFESLVDNCQSCHRALCPGPLARIRKLE